MNQLLDKRVLTWRGRVDEAVKMLHELTVHIGHEELARTVSDLRNRIHDPFMFVIVGEVKAGKSSFINALLDVGKEVCEVAPQPKTDTIQQILYGPEESTVTVNPYLKQIFHPVPILQDIAIVDTPGTNTIVAHHQEITESFIPASDLVVFVFEAKNPYRQSAWDFFQFIHADWRKKIVFVLQQKDLMNESDLAVNLSGVQEYAEKQGISNPRVFAVSAKLELEGQKENSGFLPLRQFIADNITGGRAPLLKLKNSVATSRNIVERIAAGLELREKQWDADTAFREDVKDTLDRQEQKSNHQVSVLVENLIAAYDRVTLEKESELAEGLSFFSLLKRSFASMFSRNASVKDWLDGLAKGLETDLQLGLQSKLDAGVLDLADSIQQMAKMIDLKIQNSQTILKNNHDVFAAIAERRSMVLRELQESFSNFLQRGENFTDRELFPDKTAISPSVATGSGLAVIGVVLAAVTHGMVFDITGGILTTIGLLFAGVTAQVKRRKILGTFQAEIAKGRLRLEREVSEKLQTYIKHIKARIDAIFDEFDYMLDQESKQIKALNIEKDQVDATLERLEAEFG